MTPIHELASLHDRTGVFADRADAGGVLADLLRPVPLARPLVLAIPAGGVPVAAPLAAALGADLGVAVVSKITFPWNSEAGYGAVAFDGSCRLNRDLVARAGLSEAEVAAGIATTRAKVERRVALFALWQPPAELAGRSLVLVDDGLASGFTLETAVAALHRAGADRLLVAVPTAHLEAASRLAAAVAGFYCANLRRGLSFAVAAAYRQWRDIPETEVLQLLETGRLST